ncbi:MAG: hypothetical protein DRP13_03940 [Candidatus Aenigmatarchaeota archaeon]|nr:MAG: hypothetical protein DRP18_01070 [Candidatus Aenigmarchaeota archaeon]RLJ07379.1 MAG: hypothetical protein DRP13_03940 [Candidatus Aenigmarchaeota archaeon]RLJ08164.1 MAG: hypothetical protein DRP16_01980 [Candidatus Aenigmarchaeota archaeon]
MNGEIDKLILKVLKEQGPMTTYQLAKITGLSWATVNVHCYKLKLEGQLYGELKKTISEKKMLWSLKTQNKEGK